MRILMNKISYVRISPFTRTHWKITSHPFQYPPSSSPPSASPLFFTAISLHHLFSLTPLFLPLHSSPFLILHPFSPVSLLFLPRSSSLYFLLAFPSFLLFPCSSFPPPLFSFSFFLPLPSYFLFLPFLLTPAIFLPPPPLPLATSPHFSSLLALYEILSGAAGATCRQLRLDT